jgi:hypothetical protein
MSVSRFMVSGIDRKRGIPEGETSYPRAVLMSTGLSCTTGVAIAADMIVALHH